MSNTIKTLTRIEFWDLVEDPKDPAYNDTIAGVVEKQKRRGGKVAVYRNEDFGHPDLGHVWPFTCGSPESYFEQDPPHQLPDTPSSINWRYQLVGVFDPNGE